MGCSAGWGWGEDLPYSRYVVHHRVLTDLTRRAVATELEAALSTCGTHKLRIVHDHGSEFCNTNLRAVIKAHDLLDIRTRARHPESNGIVELFNATVRRDSDDYYGDTYLQAERVVAQLIDDYNHVRLHAALGYLEPREVHFGNPGNATGGPPPETRQSPTGTPSPEPQPPRCLTKLDHYNLRNAKKSKMT